MYKLQGSTKQQQIKNRTTKGTKQIAAHTPDFYDLDTPWLTALIIFPTVLIIKYTNTF